MKAVRIHSFGGPEVLETVDAPQPEPREGEILIRVRAAGVNPVDYKIRSGGYKRADIDLPLTLGQDVSGVVERVGPGADGLREGDPVYAYLGSHRGGYAEYAIAKTNEVARRPERLDDVHAAAVPLAAITAWQALFDHGNLQAGQRVLIHGAAGGVGHFAVQFAKVRGAHVTTTSRREDFAMLRSLGADETVDYIKEDFEKRARDIDLVIDLVGGDTQQRSWNVLKEGGTIVSTLEQPSEQQASTKHAQGKVFLAEPKAEQLREIARLIDEGRVKVEVKEVLPLDEARQAHEDLERRHVQGKIVLKVE
jgi:NADPH:quinone reductase-like Zn-dependent oxidoreductase